VDRSSSLSARLVDAGRGVVRRLGRANHGTEYPFRSAPIKTVVTVRQ
jgi:hypothetical protein